MLTRTLLTTLAVGIGFTAGCAEMQSGVYKEGLRTPSGEPAYITVQHCLIASSETLPEKSMRSMQDAEQLANELFEKAKAGADFEAMIREFTDDSPPGIYQMANHGQPSDMSSRLTSKKVFARGGMAGAFGNVGFQLEVGEYGLAPYDPDQSPFGWHIIKRIR
jgi:hypothetical protein